jgi:D-proline reductase (dithiol) PrdB
MVRLTDLSALDQENMLKKIPTLPQLGGSPWATGPALAKRRIALVTTAGLHVRSDRPYGPAGGGTDYKVIPGDAAAGDVVMSHMSVNFDRSGFQQDWNVAFPLERLVELARDGIVGSVAAFHYSFMGAISPITRYEAKARELAALLKQDNVDGVLLCPV